MQLPNLSLMNQFYYMKCDSRSYEEYPTKTFLNLGIDDSQNEPNLVNMVDVPRISDLNRFISQLPRHLCGLINYAENWSHVVSRLAIRLRKL